MKNNGNVVFLVLLFSFTMIFRLDSFQVSASGINQSEAPILEPTQINEQSMIEELETGREDPACANPGDTGSTGCDSQDPACANPGDTGSTGCDSQDPACANPGDTALPACEPQDFACRGGVIGDTSEVCESSDPSCESQGGPLLFPT